MSTLSMPAPLTSQKDPSSAYPVYNVQLKIISPDSVVNNKEPQKQEPDSIKEIITKISAISLIALGGLFLLASAGLFAASIFMPTTAPLGEMLYPVGVFSIIAGLGLLQNPNKADFNSSYRNGPITLSM